MGRPEDLPVVESDHVATLETTKHEAHEEAHERSDSSSSHDITPNEKLDLQPQPGDDLSPAQPAKSNAESVYPGFKQTAAVITALLLAMFLVALVNLPEI